MNVCRYCPHVEITEEEIPDEEPHYDACCGVVSDKQYVGHTVLASNKRNEYCYDFHYVPANSIPWETMKPDENFYVPDECPMRAEHP